MGKTDKVVIKDRLLVRREIEIVDDGYYKIKFIIDDAEKSLNVIDDYDNGFYYQWQNIGDITFTQFLLQVGTQYLGSKLFSSSNYILDLSKCKKYAKELFLNYALPGLTAKQKGEYLKEISSYDIDEEHQWFAFISSIGGMDHARIDWEQYPVVKKLDWRCQKILDTFERDLKPYLAQGVERCLQRKL